MHEPGLLRRRPVALGSLRASARSFLLVLLGVLFVVVGGTISARADSEECLECHGDPDFTTERDGREISLFVDAERYAKSIHPDHDCTDCHQDLDGTDYPHTTEVEPVSCAECHDDVAELEMASIHGQKLAEGDPLAPRCWNCHGGHYIRPSSDHTSPTSILNIPVLCGQCHKEGAPVAAHRDVPQAQILLHYSQGLHGRGLFEKGLTVTAVCTSCHTAHSILPHVDPNSTVHPDHVVETCTKCHGRIPDVHRDVIEGRLWEEAPGRIPVCVECHSPHDQRLRADLDVARASLYDARSRNKRCVECHGSDAFKGRTIRRGAEEFSLFVDEAAYYAGSHGAANKACAECHTQVTSHPEERHCETIASPVDCATCHADQVAQHKTSAHGKLVAAGDPDAPTCVDCHGKHATLGHRLPVSPTFPRNVPALCSRCHQQGGVAALRLGNDEPITESYLMSIHGRGLTESGLLVTATCVDCHSAHAPLGADDPASTVHPSNVAATCGSCHFGIEEKFKSSVHWPGRTDVDAPLPTCSDCHTSHTIQRHDKDDFRLLMRDQCGRCHADETETFENTVHGQYTGGGSIRHAKCHDCHGAHGILPPSDPASSLSHQNIVGTCAQCHEGAHRRFAGYLSHATHHDRDKFPWLYWTFYGMTALLLGTLLVSVLHTGAWLTRLVMTRKEWKAHKAAAAVATAAGSGQRLYRRFDRYQRTQHLLMVLSFFTLAITGMLVKFSYTGWAQWISGTLSFDVLGTLHRFGAVVLFGVFIAHVAYVFKRRKTDGKTWKELLTGPTSILFHPRDLTQAWQSIKWFFGKGPRPRFGRYTYWEKFDYFAVFWGVAVIGLTGLMRWFPETFTYVVPGWFINVAAIIHSDEALLAVGFIFTIHFFNTHFRPDKFPMDPVIFTGRVTVDELKYDKPAEYERLVANGELEKDMVDPFPDGAEKAFKVFGFVALFVGLALIAGILYAVLFSYK